MPTEVLLAAAHPVTTAPWPALRPKRFPLAVRFSSRHPVTVGMLRLTALPAQPLKDPLVTAMLVRPATEALTPSPEPATPRSWNPQRSSVTPLAAITTPCLPLTPVMLPVR